MTPIKEMYLKLANAGVTPDAIAIAIEALELALARQTTIDRLSVEARSISADEIERRRARDREYQAKRRAKSKGVTPSPVAVVDEPVVDVSDDCQTTPVEQKGFDKESSPTPPKEITSKNINTSAQDVLFAEPFNEPIPRKVPRFRPHPLPDDFAPNQSSMAVADDLGLSWEEVLDQIQRIRDWSVNAGSKGLKSDWQATFRNWIKNNHGKATRTQPTRNSLAASLATLNAVADETIRRQGGLSESGGLTADEKLSRLWEGST